MDKKSFIKKSKKIEFEKVCRTCLSENQTLKAFNKQLVDMLKACASVNVSKRMEISMFTPVNMIQIPKSCCKLNIISI